jgi:hypothetical protein
MSDRPMRRVLIVSPHFPPVSAADMQRVRMLLPWLERNGWQAEVLAVSPDQVAAPMDPWLLGGVPPQVRVHRVDALGLGFARIPGLGTLGLRALAALCRGGDKLLGEGAFDLVYFSTTLFEVHILGPRWKRKFNVPFVMDYQDAWVSDYYRESPDVPVPGGQLKYAVASALHRWMEPRVLRECAGITSVSPEYPRQLARRYPWATALPALVQGFPGAAQDFERLPAMVPGVPPYDPQDGHVHWVYIGRGGRDMAKALRAFFLALRDQASASLLGSLKLHFIGTSYAAAGAGEKSVAPIAAEFGLGHLVDESPDRIGYLRAMWCLRNADALIVPGSDDPAYTASKIYPYLLAGRPMLAIFHANSSVVDLIGKVGGAVCVAFDSEESTVAIANRIARQWLESGDFNQALALDAAAFEPYSDAGCAAELSDFFRVCVDASTVGTPA